MDIKALCLDMSLGNGALFFTADNLLLCWSSLFGLCCSLHCPGRVGLMVPVTAVDKPIVEKKGDVSSRTLKAEYWIGTTY
jgi:hypothetical protein